MHLGRDLPPIQSESARAIGVDLTALLAAGETIAAVTARLQTLSGADQMPQLHLPQPAGFAAATAAVLVKIDDPTNALVGNIYALSFAVTTSLSQVLLPWARLRIVPGFGVTSFAGGAPAASVQSVLLTAPRLDFVLPTLAGAGYVGRDLPTANQGEALNYGIDFASALSASETVVSATAFLGLLDGADNAVLNNPAAYNSGAAAITGSVAQQMLAWPGGAALAGNTYVLVLTVLTSTGQSIPASARIRIGAVG